MTKSENFSFEDWFDNLRMAALGLTSVEFQDADSVREDFEADRDHFDVADEIAAEYGTAE